MGCMSALKGEFNVCVWRVRFDYCYYNEQDVHAIFLGEEDRLQCEVDAGSFRHIPNNRVLAVKRTIRITTADIDSIDAMCDGVGRLFRYNIYDQRS